MQVSKQREQPGSGFLYLFHGRACYLSVHTAVIVSSQQVPAGLKRGNQKSDWIRGNACMSSTVIMRVPAFAKNVVALLIKALAFELERYAFTSIAVSHSHNESAKGLQSQMMLIVRV